MAMEMTAKLKGEEKIKERKSTVGSELIASKRKSTL